MAVNFGWDLFQLNVKNSFLHGDLHETVYMQQPPGFMVEGESNKVCILKKSIYGLRQSPRAWFDKFSSLMFQFGFVRTVSDYSVFIKRSSRGCILLVV